MVPSLSQGPQQNLTTRQYLTPLMHQSLTMLTLSAAALSQHLKDVVCANPLLSYHEGRLPLTSNADLNWIPANDGQTLADKLLEQARLTSLDARTRSSLLTLVTALDDAGYLRQPLAELQAECGVPAARLDAALDQLQQFDPAGVGARDLCECLWLQAVRRDDFDAVATTILAEGQLGILATPEQWGQLPYTKAELETALAAIRRLDPAPGHQFAGNAGTLYVTPDLLWTDDEQLVVATEQLPQLTFDQAYYDSLLAAADKATKRYLRQQREQYRQLDNSLQQRQETLSLIGSFLANHQRGYLQTLDAAHLRPLCMQSCAAALGLAVSTVSRAVASKTLLVRGRYILLRTLFARPVTAEISATTIQSKIAALIAGEDPAERLSDAAICVRLGADGVQISRRTVMKYRRAAGFGNAYQR